MQKEIAIQEAAPSPNPDCSTLPESLPLATIYHLWARVSLMGHSKVFGLVSMVNVGSDTCPVPMFRVTEPSLPAYPRELVLSHDYDGWCLMGSIGIMPAQDHFIGQQAIFEIEPVTEAYVLKERGCSRHPVKAGSRGARGVLPPEYTLTLHSAGLLVAGEWTPAHQAAIDAYDAEHPAPLRKPSRYGPSGAYSPSDDELNGDPFAEGDD